MKAYEKSALGIGLDMNYGIYCADILNESAASGVIEKGDLLVMLNGSRIESMESLRSMLYTFAEGDAVSLTVIRDEQETELEAVLK
jgi:S1-C subfamily serine protease